VTMSSLSYVDKVIVVDNCSSDRTAEIARLEGALVIRRERHEGYGRALIACNGFQLSL